MKTRKWLYLMIVTHCGGVVHSLVRRWNVENGVLLEHTPAGGSARHELLCARLIVLHDVGCARHVHPPHNRQRDGRGIMTDDQGVCSSNRRKQDRSSGKA